MTKYIKLDNRRCQACWKCLESFPNHVLGKAILFKHRHAHVDHAEAYKGCKKCVYSCPNNAISYMFIPPTREPHNDQVDSFNSRVTLDLYSDGRSTTNGLAQKRG